MKLILLIVGGVFAVSGFVFLGINCVKSLDLFGLHWSRIPTTICLALAFAVFVFVSIFPFPEDVVCPSCNKEIHTYCMNCASEGVLRRNLIQNCPACGEKFGEHERFCGDCGTALK